MESVILTVDGKLWEGWTEMSVSRSLKAIAGEFDLSVTTRWSAAAPRVTFRSGSVPADRFARNAMPDRFSKAYRSTALFSIRLPFWVIPFFCVFRRGNRGKQDEQDIQDKPRHLRRWTAFSAGRLPVPPDVA